MKRKAVIFDLDGTLANTLDSIAYCGNKALSFCGYAPLEKEEYKLLVGDGADELIKRALRKVGGNEETDYRTVREAYREMFAKDCMYQVVPYEGIVEILHDLKKQGISLSVLSNKPDAEAKQVIKDLFGEGIFSLVVGQKEEIARKPSPEGVFQIMKQLGMNAEDIIYVGDTDTDMQTGKAANLFTIGVLWGFRDRVELEANHADSIIECPKELYSYFI